MEQNSNCERSAAFIELQICSQPYKIISNRHKELEDGGSLQRRAQSQLRQFH